MTKRVVVTQEDLDYVYCVKQATGGDEKPVKPETVIQELCRCIARLKNDALTLDQVDMRVYMGIDMEKIHNERI